MRSFFKVFMLIVLVAIACGTAVIFLLDKEVPSAIYTKFSDRFENTSYGKTEAVDDLKNIKIIFNSETTLYIEEENKTNTSVSKSTCEIVKEGEGNSTKVDFKFGHKDEETDFSTIVNMYIDGDVYCQKTDDEDAVAKTKEEWEESILEAYKQILADVYDFGNEGKLNAEIISMLYEGEVKVTQRGLYITYTIVKDNKTITIKYDLVKDIVKEFKSVTKTFDGETLTQQKVIDIKFVY